MKPIKILLVCILIVGISVVAYAIGIPDRYIQGLFLLMLLIYILPSIRWTRSADSNAAMSRRPLIVC